MPIDGLPDRKLHCLCWSCRRWHWPSEGILDYPPATGPLSAVFRYISIRIDDDSRRRFYCDTCHAKVMEVARQRRRMMNTSLVMIGCLALGLFLAWGLGLIDFSFLERG